MEKGSFKNIKIAGIKPNTFTANAKNIGKSFSYMSKDIADSLVPEMGNISGQAFDVNNATSDVIDALNEKIEDTKKDVKDILTNAKKQLKTGNIYTKSSMDDFDSYFEDDMSYDYTSPKSRSVTNIFNDKRQVFTSNTNGESINKSAISVIKTNSKNSVANLQALNSINNNLSQIVEFNRTTMNTYAEESAKYYADSMSMLSKIQETLAPKQKGYSPAQESDFSSIMNGNMFDLGNYSKIMYKNLNRVMAENLTIDLDTIKMFKDMSKGDDFMKSPLEEFKDNPVGTILKTSIEKVFIPKMFTESMDAFRTSMEGFSKSLVFKFNEWAEDYDLTKEFKTNNKNFFKGLLGNLLKVDLQEKNGVTLGNYEKGTVPFDGLTKKSIVEVIPGYLSQILSAVSGKERMVYDYDNGKFQSAKSLRNDFERGAMASSIMNFGDYKDKFTKDREKLGKDIDEEILDSIFYKIGKKGKQLPLYNQDKIEELVKSFDEKEQGTLRDLITFLEDREKVSNRERLALADAINSSRESTKRYWDMIEQNQTLNASAQVYAFDDVKDIADLRGPKGKKGKKPSPNSPYNSPSNEPNKDKKDILNKVLGNKEGNSERKLFKSLFSKTDKAFESFSNNVFKRAEEFFHQVIFGVNDKKGGKDNVSFKDRMGKMFDDMTEKVDVFFNSLKENIDKVVNPLKDKIKSFSTRASKTLFGEKDEDGVYRGGALSKGINKVKDFTKAKYNKFTGASMILSDGTILNTNDKSFVKDKINGFKEKLFGTNQKDFKGMNKLYSNEGIVGEMYSKMSVQMNKLTRDFIGDESDVERVKKQLKAKFPSIGSGAGIGLVASLFLPGGPIVGSIVGAGLGFANKSEKLNKVLFPEGKEDSILKNLSNKLKQEKNINLKYTAGLGLLGSMLLPGGPIIGSMLGIGTSMLNSSETFNDIIFGKDREGKTIFENLRNHFKGKKGGNGEPINIPRIASMAGMGLLASCFLPGGPVMGAIIGGILGAKFTNKVQRKLMDTLFGKGDVEKGKKRGIFRRLIDEVNHAVTLPFRKFANSQGAKMANFFDTKVLAPLGKALPQIGRDLVLTSKEVFTKMFGGIAEKINTGMKPILDRILSPFKSIAGGLFKALMGIGKGIISAPVKAISMIGERSLQRNIKRGDTTAVGMYDRSLDNERDAIDRATERTQRAKEKNRILEAKRQGISENLAQDKATYDRIKDINGKIKSALKDQSKDPEYLNAINAIEGKYDLSKNKLGMANKLGLTYQYLNDGEGADLSGLDKLKRAISLTKNDNAKYKHANDMDKANYYAELTKFKNDSRSATIARVLKEEGYNLDEDQINEISKSGNISSLAKNLFGIKTKDDNKTEKEKANEINQLENNIEVNKQLVDETKVLINLGEKNSDLLKEQISKIDEEINMTEKSISKLDELISALNNKENRTKEENDQLTSSKANLDVLNSSLNSLRADKAEMKNELKATRDEINVQQKKQAEASKQINRDRGAIDSLNAKGGRGNKISFKPLVKFGRGEEEEAKAKVESGTLDAFKLNKEKQQQEERFNSISGTVAGISNQLKEQFEWEKDKERKSTILKFLGKMLLGSLKIGGALLSKIPFVGKIMEGVKSFFTGNKIVKAITGAFSKNKSLNTIVKSQNTIVADGLDGGDIGDLISGGKKGKKKDIDVTPNTKGKKKGFLKNSLDKVKDSKIVKKAVGSKVGQKIVGSKAAKGASTLLSGALKKVGGKATTGILGKVIGVGAKAIPVIGPAITAISIIGTLKDLGVFDMLKNAIPKIFDTVKNAITSLPKLLFNGIKNIGSFVVDKFKSGFKAIFIDPLKSLGEGIKNGIYNLFIKPIKGVADSVTGFFNKIKGFFSGGKDKDKAETGSGRGNKIKFKPVRRPIPAGRGIGHQLMGELKGASAMIGGHINMGDPTSTPFAQIPANNFANPNNRRDLAKLPNVKKTPTMTTAGVSLTSNAKNLDEYKQNQKEIQAQLAQQQMVGTLESLGSILNRQHAEIMEYNSKLDLSSFLWKIAGPSLVVTEQASNSIVSGSAWNELGNKLDVINSKRKKAKEEAVNNVSPNTTIVDENGVEVVVSEEAGQMSTADSLNNHANNFINKSRDFFGAAGNDLKNMGESGTQFLSDVLMNSKLPAIIDPIAKALGSGLGQISEKLDGIKDYKDANGEDRGVLATGKDLLTDTILGKVILGGLGAAGIFGGRKIIKSTKSKLNNLTRDFDLFTKDKKAFFAYKKKQKLDKKEVKLSKKLGKAGVTGEERAEYLANWRANKEKSLLTRTKDTVVGGAKALGKGTLQLIGGIIEGAVKKAMNLVLLGGKFLKGIGNTIHNVYGKFMEKVHNGIDRAKVFYGNFKDYASNITRGIGNFSKRLFKGLGENFKNMSDLPNRIGKFIKDIPGSISGAFSKFGDTISKLANKVEDLLNWMRGKFGKKDKNGNPIEKIAETVDNANKTNDKPRAIGIKKRHGKSSGEYKPYEGNPFGNDDIFGGIELKDTNKIKKKKSDLFTEKEINLLTDDEVNEDYISAYTGKSIEEIRKAKEVFNANRGPKKKFRLTKKKAIRSVLPERSIEELVANPNISDDYIAQYTGADLDEIKNLRSSTKYNKSDDSFDKVLKHNIGNTIAYKDRNNKLFGKKGAKVKLTSLLNKGINRNRSINSSIRGNKFRVQAQPAKRSIDDLVSKSEEMFRDATKRTSELLDTGMEKISNAKEKYIKDATQAVENQDKKNKSLSINKSLRKNPFRRTNKPKGKGLKGKLGGILGIINNGVPSFIQDILYGLSSGDSPLTIAKDMATDAVMDKVMDGGLVDSAKSIFSRGRKAGSINSSLSKTSLAKKFGKNKLSKGIAKGSFLKKKGKGILPKGLKDGILGNITKNVTDDISENLSSEILSSGGSINKSLSKISLGKKFGKNKLNKGLAKGSSFLKKKGKGLLPTELISGALSGILGSQNTEEEETDQSLAGEITENLASDLLSGNSSINKGLGKNILSKGKGLLTKGAKSVGKGALSKGAKSVGKGLLSKGVKGVGKSLITKGVGMAAKSGIGSLVSGALASGGVGAALAAAAPVAIPAAIAAGVGTMAFKGIKQVSRYSNKYIDPVTGQESEIPEGYVMDKETGQVIPKDQRELGITGKMVAGVMDGFTTIKNFVSDSWNKTKELASNVWDKTKEIGSNIWNKTKEIGSNIWNKTKEIGSNIWESTKEGAKNFAKSLGDTASNIWNNTKKVAGNLIDKGKELASSAWDKAKSLFTGKGRSNKINFTGRGEDKSGVGSKEILGLASGLVSNITSLPNVIGNVIGTTLGKDEVEMKRKYLVEDTILGIGRGVDTIVELTNENINLTSKATGYPVSTSVNTSPVSTAVSSSTSSMSKKSSSKKPAKKEPAKPKFNLFKPSTWFGRGGGDAVYSGRGTSNGYSYFNQNDPRWANYDLSNGDNDTIGTAGCGPTTMAMALSSMGKKVNPIQASQYASQGGYKVQNEGVSASYISDYAAANGVNYEARYADPYSTADIDMSLASGQPVIALGMSGRGSSKLNGRGSNPYTADGHYVMITGKDSKGNYTVNDPLNASNNNRSFKPSELLGSTSSYWVDPSIDGSQAYDVNDMSGRGVQFMHPVPEHRNVTSPYGNRTHPTTGKSSFHTGIDLSSPGDSDFGAPILASAGGTVTHSGPLSSYGWLIKVDHGGGYETRYAHLSELMAKVGDTVTPGQQIAKMGGKKGHPGAGTSTGSHLHFEIRKNGDHVNPEDYINKDIPGVTLGGAPSEQAGGEQAAPQQSSNPLEAIFQATSNLFTSTLFGKKYEKLNQPQAASGGMSPTGEAVKGNKYDLSSYDYSGLSQTKRNHIDLMIHPTLETYRTHGLFPSLTIAQSAAESGWGPTSGLAKDGKAMFGIKADSSWTGKVYNGKTFEYGAAGKYNIVDGFRAYDSYEEGIIDRANFLKSNPRYTEHGVFSATTPEDQAKAFKAAGYATDPNYANSLIKLINDSNLKIFDNPRPPKLASEGGASNTVDVNTLSTGAGMRNPLNKLSSGRGAQTPQDTANGHVYYSQTDPRWKESPFGSSTVGVSGCGATTMAMISAQVTGQPITPDETAKWGGENGYYVSGAGMSWGFPSAIAKNYGFDMTSIWNGKDDKTKEAIKASLKENKAVALSGNNPQGEKPFTSGGHIVAAVGMDGEDKVIINDPISKERSMSLSFDDVFNKSKNAWASTKAHNGVSPTGGATAGGESGGSASGGNPLENILQATSNLFMNTLFGKKYEKLNQPTGGATAGGVMAGDVSSLAGIPMGTLPLAQGVLDNKASFDAAQNEFGVESEVLQAIAMQESGGNPNIKKAAWGLMQIENGGTTDEFINFGKNRPDGPYTSDDRLVPAKAIPFAASRISSDLKHYSGDYAKTIQAYNFSKYSLDALLKHHPDDWMANRSKVGQYNGTGKSKYGDPQYIEHVMRYYHGNTLRGSAPQVASTETTTGAGRLMKSIGRGISKVKKLIPSNPKTEGRGNKVIFNKPNVISTGRGTANKVKLSGRGQLPNVERATISKNNDASNATVKTVNKLSTKKIVNNNMSADSIKILELLARIEANTRNTASNTAEEVRLTQVSLDILESVRDLGLNSSNGETTVVNNVTDSSKKEVTVEDKSKMDLHEYNPFLGNYGQNNSPIDPMRKNVNQIARGN